MEGLIAKMCEIHVKPRKRNLPLIMPLICHYYATILPLCVSQDKTAGCLHGAFRPHASPRCEQLERSLYPIHEMLHILPLSSEMTSAAGACTVSANVLKLRRGWTYMCKGSALWSDRGSLGRVLLHWPPPRQPPMKGLWQGHRKDPELHQTG